MKRPLFFLLVLFLILPSFAQGEFIVKMVYFQPTNVKANLTPQIQRIVGESQQWYADEMERNGFDRKTYGVERNPDSTVKVHIVKGKKSAVHYSSDTWNELLPDLPNHLRQDSPPWDKQDMIFIYILGGVTGVNVKYCGIGWPHHSGRYGGGSFIGANTGCGLTASLLSHEIGHCFGLYHKPPGSPERLEDYEARWLDKHYHFNHAANNFEHPEMPHALNVTALEGDRIRIGMTGRSKLDGLHQAMLVRSSDILVLASDFLQGNNREMISFEVARHLLIGRVFIEVMDTRGNYVMKNYDVVMPQPIKVATPVDVTKRTNKNPDVHVPDDSVVTKRTNKNPDVPDDSVSRGISPKGKRLTILAKLKKRPR